jgi:hypothetical protein
MLYIMGKRRSMSDFNAQLFVNVVLIFCVGTLLSQHNSKKLSTWKNWNCESEETIAECHL